MNIWAPNWEQAIVVTWAGGAIGTGFTLQGQTTRLSMLLTEDGGQKDSALSFFVNVMTPIRVVCSLAPSVDKKNRYEDCGNLN